MADITYVATLEGWRYVAAKTSNSIKFICNGMPGFSYRVRYAINSTQDV